MGCTPSTQNSGTVKGFCPQKHALKTKRRPDNVKYCTKCSSGIVDDYLCCDICGYDICKACALKMK